MRVGNAPYFPVLEVKTDAVHLAGRVLVEHEDEFEWALAQRKSVEITLSNSDIVNIDAMFKSDPIEFSGKLAAFLLDYTQIYNRAYMFWPVITLIGNPPRFMTQVIRKKGH